MNDLNTLTDTLNEVLERAEVALTKHRVAVWIESNDFDEGRRLGIKKIGSNDWKLVWSGNGVSTSVLSSSRKSRLIAAEYIPQLHEALQVEKARLAEQTRTAVVDLERFVEGLEADE